MRKVRARYRSCLRGRYRRNGYGLAGQSRELHDECIAATMNMHNSAYVSWLQLLPAVDFNGVSEDDLLVFLKLRGD